MTDLSEVTVQFVVTQDPNPASSAPPFVKEAYRGLRLTSSRKIEPGTIDYLPHGAYLVKLAEFLHAMELHNSKAGAWSQAMWGIVAAAAEEHSDSEIELVFRCEFCEVVQ